MLRQIDVFSYKRLLSVNTDCFEHERELYEYLWTINVKGMRLLLVANDTFEISKMLSYSILPSEIL